MAEHKSKVESPRKHPLLGLPYAELRELSERARERNRRARPKPVSRRTLALANRMLKKLRES